MALTGQLRFARDKLLAINGAILQHLKKQYLTLNFKRGTSPDWSVENRPNWLASSQIDSPRDAKTLKQSIGS